MRGVRIGILAVQGDFEAHAAMLARLGAETVEVRTPAQLQGCDGLILPGGESTTQLQFLQEEGLADAIGKFAKQGGAIFGTCAGAILLAAEVQNPRQDSLRLLDMTVLRNAYGRQIASDVVNGPTKLKKQPLEMVFIRGPIIERAGPLNDRASNEDHFQRLLLQFRWPVDHVAGDLPPISIPQHGHVQQSQGILPRILHFRSQ